MRIGIFAKTFPRSTLREVLAAVVEHGIGCVQFNLSVTGRPTLPERLDPHLAQELHQEAAALGVELAAISGTFNMIDPAVERRADGLRRLRVLAETSALAGIPIVTLCTGTRDSSDMWRSHPANRRPDAWSDLVASMRIAADIAEECGLTMAFEPEQGNVVDSAARAQQLLSEIGSAHVGVVIDGANLMHNNVDLEETIQEAMSLIGDAAVIAHAKDISLAGDGTPYSHAPLDACEYVRVLQRSGFDGPLIVHGIAEEHVDRAMSALRQGLAIAGR